MKKKVWAALLAVSTLAMVGASWMQADDQAPTGPALQHAPGATGPAFPPPAPLRTVGASEVSQPRQEETTEIVAEPPRFLRIGGVPRSSAVVSQSPGAGFPSATASDVGASASHPDQSTTGLAGALSAQSTQQVTLQWVGPAQIKVGQPFVYELVIHNVGVETAKDVVVRDQLPQGMRLISVMPKATEHEGGFLWQLGDLQTHDERRIRIEMVAEQKGEVACQATVTATTPATARFRVCEPKLAVQQTCPETVMVGDPVTVTIAVSNPGDGSADGIVVRSVLSSGLHHEKGKDFSVEVGSLAPGETRTIQLVCATTQGGRQSIKTAATAGGRLKAEGESFTTVSEPKLNVAIQGPRLRYLDRQATYTVRIENPGDAPANNVRVAAILPAGFKYVDSSNNGRHDYTTRTVAWFVGTLDAGQAQEITYKCLAVQPGQQTHSASAVALRSLKADATTVTAVEGISALLLEVVDIDDPVEVGAETAYEIRVTNQGSRAATNVTIEATVPVQMKVLRGQGPTDYRVSGQQIHFAPLPKLAPRADAIYRVHVQGVGVGDTRFRAQLSSDSLSEPVSEEESTKVYGD